MPRIPRHWRALLLLLLAVIFAAVDAYNLQRNGLQLDRWIPFGYAGAFVAFAAISRRAHR